MTSVPLVAFEAGWLCQVQRRSFSDLDEMQELRADLLDEAGVTSSEYEEFRTALDSDPDRRSEVLMVFEGSCK